MGSRRASSTTITAAMVLGGLAVLALPAAAVAARLYRRHEIRGDDDAAADDLDDAYYLRCCHEIRRALSKPRHSGFRVVAMLLLEEEEQQQQPQHPLGDDHHHHQYGRSRRTTIVGANDEASPCISGALCAERAALLHYRTRYKNEADGPQIAAVYIVSDHPEIAIPPGCLCREYLYGHPAVDPASTRIVLQSAAGEAAAVSIYTLPELYPYASVTARCRSTKEAVARSLTLEPVMQQWLWRLRDASNLADGGDSKRSVLGCLPVDFSLTDLRRLLAAAREQAVRGTASYRHIHPVCYGAAAAIVRGTGSEYSTPSSPSPMMIVAARQLPALEYGGTQDAVCRLMAVVAHCWRDASEQSPAPPVQLAAVVQVDQWGLIHAPFAASRSLLVEHGYGRAAVLVATTAATRTGPHDEMDANNLMVDAVPAFALAPLVPAIFGAPSK